MAGSGVTGWAASGALSVSAGPSSPRALAMRRAITGAARRKRLEAVSARRKPEARASAGSVWLASRLAPSVTSGLGWLIGDAYSL
jgi:hypothetical protein